MDSVDTAKTDSAAAPRRVLTDSDRKALRRQRRQASEETRLRLEAAQRRRQMMFLLGGGLIVALCLAALVYWLVRPAAAGDIQSLPNQGQIHVPHNQSHPAYNSKPPTSGWHYADAVASWGIVTQPWPDELQVHALEHGGIIISYDCPSGCADDVSKLEQIVRGYPSKVILQPYPGFGHKIALTAWTKLEYLEQVDEGKIKDFIGRYKNQGPEQVPDMPQ